jgi:hypothetical protein
LENERLGFVPHIHRASRRYLDETGKADGFAERSDRFYTLDGALACLLKDCNVDGLSANPDQPSLFN